MTGCFVLRSGNYLALLCYPICLTIRAEEIKLGGMGPTAHLQTILAA